MIFTCIFIWCFYCNVIFSFPFLACILFPFSIKNDIKQEEVKCLMEGGVMSWLPGIQTVSFFIMSQVWTAELKQFFLNPFRANTAAALFNWSHLWMVLAVKWSTALNHSRHGVTITTVPTSCWPKCPDAFSKGLMIGWTVGTIYRTEQVKEGF